MTIKIYGYAGCTTVKKARDWLGAKDLEADYAHFNKVPNLKEELKGWVEKAGLETVLNTKSQAFKKLDEAEQQTLLASQEAAIEAMANDPRFIKRPLATDGTTLLTGFKEADWQEAFKG